MARGLLLTVCFSLLFAASAQHALQTGDFYIRSPARNVWHVAGREDGLMVVHDLGPGRFALHYLDSNLQQRWSDTLKADRLKAPVFGVYSPLNRCMLFFIPLSFHEVQVYRYDCRYKRLSMHYLELPAGMRIADSCPAVCGDRLMWYTEKDAHVQLFSADLDSFKVRMLPYTFPHRENRIITFQSMEDKAVGMAVLTDCFGADRIHYLTVLDTGGREMAKPVFAGLDEHRQPYIWHGARFRLFPRNEVRVIGWWGQSRLSQSSSGYFFMRLSAGEASVQSYLPFTALSRFYAFLGPGGENRMERKRRKKEDKGKILRWNGEGVFAGEFAYRGEWMVNFDMLSYWSANSLFPDTRFGAAEFRNYARPMYENSHSMVFVLDSAGGVLKDYCIPHDQVFERVTEPERFSTAYYDTAAGLLRYKYINRARVYRYSLGENIQAGLDTLMPPEGYHPRWLRSEKSVTSYWYSNVCLVYGLQRVRRKGGFPGTRWIYRYTAFRG